MSDCFNSSPPRCLVDCDGVLVRFVEGACDLHRRPNPYDDPANWGRYGVEELLGISRNDFFGPLGEDFWAGLRPTAECFEIVGAAEEVFGPENVCVMTSPVRTAGCAEGKIRWLRRHLPQFSRRFLIGPEKQFAASPRAWLIDDSDENVDKFRRWGGNAYLVPRPWNSAHGQAAPTGRIIWRRLFSSLLQPGF